MPRKPFSVSRSLVSILVAIMLIISASALVAAPLYATATHTKETKNLQVSDATSSTQKNVSAENSDASLSSDKSSEAESGSSKVDVQASSTSSNEKKDSSVVVIKPENKDREKSSKHTENNTEDEDDTTTEEPSKPVEWTPSGTDLRERGFVTAVKDQSPFGTCWAFGTIAAAETSILSKTKQTYKDTKFDLSESHLINFCRRPITANDDAIQAGEGLEEVKKKKSFNKYYDGVFSEVVDGLFSTGVGPALEKDYPYHGKESLTTYQYMKQNKTDEIEAIKEDYEEDGGISDEEAEKIYNENLSGYKKADQYSAEDDWSLNDSQRRASAGYVLVDSNVLPTTYLDSDSGEFDGFSQSAVDAIKKEIDKGRGVAVSYCADDSLPGEKSDDPLFMDLKTYAHYTFDPSASSNHTVCIVGYDDNYPKENFLQGTSKAGYSKTPPQNGAWIVKNSWGSETDFVINKDGRPIAKSDWGIRNNKGQATGYFYLSYYDKSTNSYYSYNFSNKLDVNSFSQYQYDYMTSLENAYNEQSDSLLKVANIYTAKGDEVITSIGVRAYSKKTTSTVRVYKLQEEYDNPEEGELVSEASASYDYAGYHRIPLDEKVRLYPDDIFSIVVENETDEGYEISANRAPSKKAAAGQGLDFYGVAITHPGESFLYKDDTWVDWTDYQKTDYYAKHMLEIPGTFNGGIPDYSVDNFTAKAFVLAAEDSTTEDPAEKESDKKNSNVSKQSKNNKKTSAEKSSAEKSSAEKSTQGNDYSKETTNFVSSTKGAATPKTGDSPLIEFAICAASLSILCAVVLRKRIKN